MLKSTRLTFPSLFKSTESGGDGLLYQYAVMEKSTRLTFLSPFESPFSGAFLDSSATTVLVPTVKPTALLNELISLPKTTFDFVKCWPFSSGEVSKLYKYAPLASALILLKNSASELTEIVTSLLGTDWPKMAMLSPRFTSLLSTAIVGA